MTLGRRRREQQDTFWVATDRLGSGPRNAFYDRLNDLLAEIEFDRQLEEAAEPFYERTGRKSLPPGVYFRMIFIGYFEDISVFLSKTNLGSARFLDPEDEARHQKAVSAILDLLDRYRGVRHRTTRDNVCKYNLKGDTIPVACSW